MSRRRRISVAMATCNGAPYVAAQLQSILAQTRPADEIVVFDDASDDATLAIVRSMLGAVASSARVVANPTRLGAVANFEQCVAAAGGDIIVLADQDDVWTESKLASIEAAFVATPNLGAVFSDATLIGSDGRRLDSTLWQRVDLQRSDLELFACRRGVEVLLRQNVVTGATLAFDARLRDLILPFPDTGYHDAWIALLVSAVAPLRAAREPLIQYRLHGSNTAGLPARNLLGRIAARRRRTRVHDQAEAFFQAAHQRLGEQRVGDAHVMAALEAKIAHLRFRRGLSSNPMRRMLPVLAQARRGEYRRFSREGSRSAVYDLIYG